MAVARSAQDPKLIARLQRQAERRPRAYRLQLTLIAIAGDLALTAVQVLPIAAPIFIGALWVNSAKFWWICGAGIVLLVWLMRPRFRFSGRELPPAEARALHDEVAALKRKLQVPGRMRVYLDGSFNASASQARGLFGIIGTHSALTLGVPLLLTLDREQALAVIAHEFGHFSRRHGRLGAWLYRARAGWMAFADQVSHSNSTLDRATAWYARRFLPYFSARSFVHSRQCEYEADADAAYAMGGDAIASALTRIAVLDRLWSKRLPRQVADWQKGMRVPPSDFYQRIAAQSKLAPAGELQAWLEEELREPSGWLDTHPSLAERLDALEAAPGLATAADCAGDRLLGAAWPAVLAEFSKEWATKAQRDWQVQHLWLKHVAGPLLEADDAGAASWSDERRLARAKALRVLDPPAGLAALRALHERNPADARVTFAYAEAMLEEDEEEVGHGLMEVLAREHPAFRVQAFRRVVAYFERRGNQWQAERWSGWLAAARQPLAEAIDLAMKRVEAGLVEPSSLTAAEKALVKDVAAADPCITGHCLLQRGAELQYAKNRPAVAITVHVLGLSIDHAAATRDEQDEESIHLRFRDLMRRLVPPEHWVVVPTYLTTETLPAVYRQSP